MIDVSGLSLVFTDPDSGQPNPVIQDLDFHARKGESVAIIGPSGCGKSSFLFVLAGLTQATEGTALVNQEPVPKPRREIALILQEAGLLPWKTVWQNGTLGPSEDENARDERLRSAISELGIEGMENRFPAQLSGGERKRVNLARALAQNAQTVLMDEPLAALDALTKEATQNLILELWKHHKFTLVLVTHDIDEAVFLGERVLVFAPRPTKVLHEVANSNMGDIGYRGTTDFFEKVQEVRGLLQL
jgi:NitT/TauT family transport system ATP-binding protein